MKILNGTIVRIKTMDEINKLSGIEHYSVYLTDNIADWVIVSEMYSKFNTLARVAAPETYKNGTYTLKNLLNVPIEGTWHYRWFEVITDEKQLKIINTLFGEGE